MLVLFETPVGFALFQLQDEGILKTPEKLFPLFENGIEARKLLVMKHFFKFEDMKKALAATAALVEGKLNSDMKSALKPLIGKNEKLAVADIKLAASIQKKLKVQCVSNSTITELMRCIRFQCNDLLSGQISSKEMQSMTLGLAHSLSRYKIKFSPDKVDSMVVQAVDFLNDLNKEWNFYMMRLKEWYGGHFPELQRVVADNVTYARVAEVIGNRSTADFSRLSAVVSEEMATNIYNAARVSMGTEITEEDIFSIKGLITQVLELSEYRDYLSEYLKNRMNAIAPNLSQIVGELLGAQLISKAGSLMGLAKLPASTIQVMGAEKAFFRSVKSNKPTPKYGIIFHAGLVGRATPKSKGKISRMVANKAALAVRIDALGDESTTDITQSSLRQLNSALELTSEISGAKKFHSNVQHNPKYIAPTPPQTTAYNTSSDFIIKADIKSSSEPSTPSHSKDHSHKKRKREKDSSHAVDNENIPKKAK